MNSSICGANCTECADRASCPGCAKTQGCPFGKPCFVAKYIQVGGMWNYLSFKNGLIDEINALHIEGMDTVTELYPLCGKYINLDYPIPSGTAKFLQDDEIYLGTQVQNRFDDSGMSYFGIVAGESFLLVSAYGANGTDPELVLYKRR